jgi:hypothetical protein
VGKITGSSNRTKETKFIASQWYKDDSGLIHTLLICCECGAFLDCKLSLLKMLLMFFRRLYVTKQVYTLEEMKRNAIARHTQDQHITLHDSFAYTAAIGSSTVDCLVEKGLLDESFKS